MAITQEMLDGAMQNAWVHGFRACESGEGTGECPKDLSRCIEGKVGKVAFKEPAVEYAQPIVEGNIPSEYDPALCDARVWAGGDGAQCSRAKMDGENLCKGCFNRFSKLEEGFQLQFGLITEARPAHQMHVEEGKAHKWNDLKKEKKEKVKKVKKEKVKKAKALSVAELKSALTDGGVDFPKKVKKAELLEMHKQMLEGKIEVKEVKDEEVKDEEVKKEKALSVAELKSALTDAGVDFPKKVKKAELVTLHKQMLEGKIAVNGPPQPVLELDEDTSDDIPEEEIAAPKEKHDVLEYEGVTYQVNPRNHDVYDMSGDEVGTYEDGVIRWATTEMEEKHNAYAVKQDEEDNSNSDSSDEDE